MDNLGTNLVFDVEYTSPTEADSDFESILNGMANMNIGPRYVPKGNRLTYPVYVPSSNPSESGDRERSFNSGCNYNSDQYRHLVPSYLRKDDTNKSKFSGYTHYNARGLEDNQPNIQTVEPSISSLCSAGQHTILNIGSTQLEPREYPKYENFSYNQPLSQVIIDDLYLSDSEDSSSDVSFSSDDEDTGSSDEYTDDSEEDSSGDSSDESSNSSDDSSCKSCNEESDDSSCESSDEDL